MSKIHTWVSVLLLATAIAAGLMYLNGHLSKVEAAARPVATPTISFAPIHYVTTRYTEATYPAGGNGTPVMVTGFIVSYDDNKEPYIQRKRVLSIAADPFERFHHSLPFDAACTTYADHTSYECILTPPSPATKWGSFGVLAARFPVSTDTGDVLIGQFSFQINPSAPTYSF